MPLVASNMNPSTETEEWQNKLVGKTIHEDQSNETTFSKRELPEQHRIIKPGTMVTKDYKEDRLNVHLNDEDVCTHVTHG